MTSEYWLEAMRNDGFTEEELRHGCDQADNYKERSKLTLGVFKELCRPEPIVNSAMYRVHSSAQLTHKKSDPETIERFRQERKRNLGEWKMTYSKGV